MRNFYDKKDERIAYLRMQGTDMQNNKGVFFTNSPTQNDIVKRLTADITQNNVIQMSIYLAIRHIISDTWLNDRDQFLFPNENWKNDNVFQTNCFAFALFHGQNKITSNGGTNHWIPFTESEVNSREKFDSNFMSKFINGKLKIEQKADLLNGAKTTTIEKLTFSPEAKAVFDAGRELWKYYHKQPNCNVNASLYDIRAHFQQRNESGKMNHKSQDETYMKLINDLRKYLLILAQKIEPKVYEYEFLKA